MTGLLNTSGEHESLSLLGVLVFSVSISLNVSVWVHPFNLNSPTPASGVLLAGAVIQRFCGADQPLHLDLVARPIGASQEAIRLRIADDLFGAIVPFQVSSQAC